MLPWLGGWGEGSPGTSACPEPSTPCGAALRPTRAPCSSPGELGSPGCTGLGESNGPPHPSLPRPPRHAPPGPAPPAPLTVQPSRAVWYSAASVASLSSSWYRGQLRVGNLSSWGKLRLREDSLTGTPVTAEGAGNWAVELCVSGANLSSNYAVPPRSGRAAWGWRVTLPRQLSPGEGLTAPRQHTPPGAAQLGQTASPSHWLPPAQRMSLSIPPTPLHLPSPLTLSSVTGTVCTGMGLQAASGRPGAASGNSPARLA